MDFWSLGGMTEADLGSDFSDEQEPDSTSEIGLDSRRYPSFAAQISTNMSLPQPLFPNNTTTSDTPTQCLGHSFTDAVQSKHLRPAIVSALPGTDTSKTTVIGFDALSPKFRPFFSEEYSYFNIVQSKVFADVFESDNSLALCSPTGSGKTVVMELAIIKQLADHDRIGEGKFPYKIIYMSPLKGICSEKYREWSAKFPQFGLNVCEITGDSEEKDFSLVYKSNLIITTPEKWDSITRKWKKERSALMSSVKLILVDEVHQLSDPSRGACLEAVITRIKTAKKDARFIAVSASAPNIDDVATWIGRHDLPGIYKSMGQEYRPVKLNAIVKGYPKYGQNDFVFDKMLEKQVPSLVNEFSDSKPTLVFCMTRKGCVSAAKIMAEASTLDIALDHQQLLKVIAEKIKDQQLKELVRCGVAYHHAGVDRKDRDIVETALINSQILVLFSTSTLSQGVNLPVHLVIVKGTVRFINQGMVEYTETDIQQMIGRAGRPQFDDQGVAIIMTSDRDQLKYEKQLRGEKILESYIHLNLAEHLNAEIVLETINNIPAALEWIHSTFFYIRCRKNRCHFYGLENGLTDAQVETRLQDNCTKELNGLQKYQMITMDEFRHEIKATDVGRLMAHYYVSFDTMKLFAGLKRRSTVKDVLQLVCSCKELARDIELRMDDKKYLFSFHGRSKDAPLRPQVRFSGSEKIKTRAQKNSTLLQIEFGMIQDEQLSKYRVDVNKLLKSGTRLTRCLAEYATLPATALEKGYATVKNCIILSKCFKRGLWENTPYVSKQFEGIGQKFAKELACRSLSTMRAIASSDPRVVDGILNRKNNRIVYLASRLPKYRLNATEVEEGPEEVKIELEIGIENWKEVSRDPTAGKHHCVYLLVGDGKDNILVVTKIKDEEMLSGNYFKRRFSLQKSPDSVGRNGTEFQVSVISESWIGIDLPENRFVIDVFPNIKHGVTKVLAALGSSNLGSVVISECTSTVTMTAPEGGDRRNDSTGSARNRSESDLSNCQHKCRDKINCKHECCKSGPKSATKKSKPVRIPKNNVAKQIKFIVDRQNDGSSCSQTSRAVSQVQSFTSSVINPVSASSLIQVASSAPVASSAASASYHSDETKAGNNHSVDSQSGEEAPPKRIKVEEDAAAAETDFSWLIPDFKF